MSDKAIVVLWDGRRHVSPQLYLHVNGSDVPRWLTEFYSKLEAEEITGDTRTAFALWTAMAFTKSDEVGEVRVFPLPDAYMAAILSGGKDQREAVEGLSPGESGAVLFNVTDGKWYALNGELEEFDQSTLEDVESWEHELGELA